MNARKQKDIYLTFSTFGGRRQRCLVAYACGCVCVLVHETAKFNGSATSPFALAAGCAVAAAALVFRRKLCLRNQAEVIQAPSPRLGPLTRSHKQLLMCVSFNGARILTLECLLCAVMPGEKATEN